MRPILILVPALIAAGAVCGQDAGTKGNQGTGNKQEKAPQAPVPKGAKDNQPGGEGGKETRIVFPLPYGPQSTPPAIYVSAGQLSFDALVKAQMLDLELGRTVMLRGRGLDRGTKVQLTVVELATPKGSETTLEAQKIGSSVLQSLALSDGDKEKARKVLSNFDVGPLGQQDLENLSVIYLACDGDQLVTLDQISKDSKNTLKFCSRYELKDAKQPSIENILRLAERAR